MIDELSLMVLNHAKTLGDWIDELQTSAQVLTKCKRKGVGVGIIRWQGREDDEFPSRYGRYFNGIDSTKCTNVKGNCGCVHAEQVAICAALKARLRGIWLIQNYSPCTHCANLIVTSGIVDGIVYKIDTKHDMRGLAILNMVGIHAEKL